MQKRLLKIRLARVFTLIFLGLWIATPLLASPLIVVYESKSDLEHKDAFLMTGIIDGEGDRYITCPSISRSTLNGSSWLVFFSDDETPHWFEWIKIQNSFVPVISVEHNICLFRHMPDQHRELDGILEKASFIGLNADYDLERHVNPLVIKGVAGVFPLEASNICVCDFRYSFDLDRQTTKLNTWLLFPSYMSGAPVYLAEQDKNTFLGVLIVHNRSEQASNDARQTVCSSSVLSSIIKDYYKTK